MNQYEGWWDVSRKRQAPGGCVSCVPPTHTPVRESVRALSSIRPIVNRVPNRLEWWWGVVVCVCVHMAMCVELTFSLALSGRATTWFFVPIPILQFAMIPNTHTLKLKPVLQFSEHHELRTTTTLDPIERPIESLSIDCLFVCLSPTWYS